MAFTKYVPDAAETSVPVKGKNLSNADSNVQAFMPTLPAQSLISQLRDGLEFYRRSANSLGFEQPTMNESSADTGMESFPQLSRTMNDETRSGRRVEETVEEIPHVALHLVSELLEDETITMSDATPPDDDDESPASTEHTFQSPLLASSWPASWETEPVFSSSWSIPDTSSNRIENSSSLFGKTASSPHLFIPDVGSSPPMPIFTPPSSSIAVSPLTPVSPESLSPLQTFSPSFYESQASSCTSPSALFSPNPASQMVSGSKPWQAHNQQLSEHTARNTSPSWSHRHDRWSSTNDHPNQGQNHTTRRQAAPNSVQRPSLVQGLMEQVEIASKELHILQQERRQAEQDFYRLFPSRRSSKLPNIRMPPNPTRVDRILVEELREHSKVEILIGRIERARKTALQSNVGMAIDRWQVCLREIQSYRKQQHQEHPRRMLIERDAITLTPLIGQLTSCTGQVRSALRCAIQMSIDGHQPRSGAERTTYAPRGVS